MDAQRPQKATLAYEKALLWRELFDLAQRQKVDQEEIVAMAYRVAGMHFVHKAMLALNIVLQRIWARRSVTQKPVKCF